MINTATSRQPYRIDAYLIFCHVLLLILSFGLWKMYPHITIKPDMSGLFFMIISVFWGIVGLIPLAVSLPRLDRTIRNLALYKFALAFLYWISSTAIFVLFGINKFFFNNPLVSIIFVLIFFSSIYFSVIRLANMRKKDWLILGGILTIFALLFFL